MYLLSGCFEISAYYFYLQLKPKYPDFKRKDGDLALWLDSAPMWVLSELEGLQFDVPTQKSKQVNQYKGIVKYNIVLFSLLIVFGCRLFI